jgi:membrane protein YdbS with pleckstrin-like domain
MYFSKAEQLLEAGEEIDKSVNPSRFDQKYVKSFLTSIALFVGVTGILAANSIYELGMPNMFIVASYLIPAIVYLRSDIERQFTMYHFTDREIIEEDGVLNKDFDSIPYSRIQDVVLDEDMEERIFDVGDIHVRTAGTDNSETALNGLKDPEKYKREITKRASSARGDSGSSQNESSSDLNSGSRGLNGNSGTKGDSSSGIDSGLLDDELDRVERQIQQLNQRSNNQGLSESERERWYKLEGQKELLERFEDQMKHSSGGSTDFSGSSDLDI